MPCAGANGLLGTRCMSDEPIAKVVVPSEALMAGQGRLLRAINQRLCSVGPRLNACMSIAAVGKTAVYTVYNEARQKHD